MSQILPLSPHDTITSVIPVDSFDSNKYLLLLTAHGFLKKTPLAAFQSMTARGLSVVTLEEGDVLKWARQCIPGQEILVATRYYDGSVASF